MFLVIFLIGVMAVYSCKGFGWFIGLLTTIVCGSIIFVTGIEVFAGMFRSLRVFLQTVVNTGLLVLIVVWILKLLDNWR